MKKSFRYIVLSIVILMGLSAPQAFAGNKDRSGQAGASELLINPWAASSGWGNAGMSFVHGVDAIYGNVAGISVCNKLDLNFTHTSWLVGVGNDTRVSSFGFLARVGESSVLGLSFMSFSIGEIPITTVQNPDPGTLGTYKPNLMNINLSFAKSFSNSISGGFNLKIISESIKDMSGVGVALDAGIQYVTGPFDNIHFGITLKNIGPTMKFSGDGISLRVFMDHGNQQFTMVQRVDDFELPTQLSIAAAYDWLFAETNRITVAGNFCSNSFTNDQFTLGLEYGWKEMFMIRAGYTYEKGIWSKEGFKDGFLNDDDCMNINRGLSAGVSVQVPMGSMKFAVDYSYRDTYVFNGTHSVGARIIF